MSMKLTHSLYFFLSLFSLPLLFLKPPHQITAIRQHQ